ncbi:MAG: iron-sulfur cluster repair di-iron protein [Candidatus Korobacteraceae bacterium]|jgi:regulator of cell morphogenesis and NO signaling
MPTQTETVREIALNQPSSIRVFEQFGIDYCCGGRKPLAVACTEQNIEIASVLAALESAAEAPSQGAKDWASASLESLIEHIVSKHHEYVKRELPRLGTLARKVVERHAPNHSELPEIQDALANLDSELTQHLGKEERVLFPYIAEFERSLAGKNPRPHGCFGTVANPIAMMTQEHDAAGAILADIRKLSGNFSLPEDACPTYHAFYDGLKEFEQDLHQHIHLENNILFPRSIEMEASEAS